MQEVRLAEGLKEVQESAFMYKHKDESVVISPSLDTEDSSGYIDDIKLTQIELPMSLDVIGKQAFGFIDGAFAVISNSLITTLSGPIPINGFTEEGFTIYGYTDSGADHYAQDNEIPFVSIGKIPSIERTHGGNLRWSMHIPTGVLTISGTGPMADGAPWKEYAEQINTVIIAPGVTSVCADAFSFCENLISVTLPEGITELGDGSFGYCRNLKTIVLPDSLICIGSWAFTRSSLTEINIDPGNQHLVFESGALLNGDRSRLYIYLKANTAESYTVPDTVTQIDDNAFGGDEALTSVELPEGLDHIGRGLFMYCTALESIDIPENVGWIDAQAFCGCSSLKTATIRAHVGTIYGEAFGHVHPDFTIFGATGSFAETYATEMGFQFAAVDFCGEAHAFDDGRVTVLSTCTEEGTLSYICRRCGYIKTEQFPPNGHVMGDWINTVEWNCTQDGEGYRKCFHCEYTEYRHLPARGHDMGEWESLWEPTCTDTGFELKKCKNCGYQENRTTDSLGHDYVDTVYPPTCGEMGHTERICSRCGHVVWDFWEDSLGHSFTNYVSDNNATCTNDGTMTAVCDRCDVRDTIREEGTATGHDYANGICTRCGESGSEQLQIIATGWSGATKWTLTGDGVLTFYGEGNMKDYGWGGNQPWLNKGVEITSVVVEDGVTAIGTGAFKDLTTLESVILPESGLTKIGEAAFYGCTSLKELYIPDGIYTIWEYTFKNCFALEKIRLSKTLEKIDQGAFEACVGLTELFLPTNMNIIGAWSFKGCSGLKEADIQWADATEIRDGAFKNCTALKKIFLPANIQVLGDSCFYGIGAVKFVVPATVTDIRDWCFARAKMTEIVFEGDAPAIGEGAFNKITLTAYYLSGNASWTADVMQNYGGSITWQAN